MPAQATKLFLLGDLEDSSRTSKLADSDLDLLRVVTDWITTFVTQPQRISAALVQHVGTPLGASAVQALAKKLRLTNWRSREA